MTRHTIAFAILLFGWGCIIAHCVGCKSPEQAGANAAESAYTAALLRCVDDSRTLAESRACRQRVNLEWGIVEREAGAR